MTESPSERSARLRKVREALALADARLSEGDHHTADCWHMYARLYATPHDEDFRPYTRRSWSQGGAAVSR